MDKLVDDGEGNGENALETDRVHGLDLGALKPGRRLAELRRPPPVEGTWFLDPEVRRAGLEREDEHRG